MRPFAYARPATLAEAVALVSRHGAAARILAGGTDLIIRLRDGTLRPDVVIDLKRIPELRPEIREEPGRLWISAGTVMTDILEHPTVQRHFPALVEGARVVGSIQIRNRATLAGNLCNASPAADTAPALLVYGAQIEAVGPAGRRSIPLDAFLIRSGVTSLQPDEIVAAIELPLPARPTGSIHLRHTRRRGHDLASVTLCCAVDDAGVTRLAYGSVGPRPVLRVEETGVLADPATAPGERDAVLARLLAEASPSPTSMRAGPDYRLAMLRLLAHRGLAAAIDRLAGQQAGAR